MTNSIEEIIEAGVKHYKSGDKEKAVSYFNQALSADPESAEAYFNLGIVYKDLEDKKQAIDCFSRAVELNPLYVQAYGYLAFIYGTLYSRKKNREFFEEAKNNYLKILELLPNQASIHFDLGNLYGIDNQPDETLKCYEKALKLGLHSSLLYSNYGALICETKANEALQYHLKALEIEPDSPLVHYNLGYTYMTLKNVEESEKHFKRAIELKPDYWKAYVSLATLYFLNKNFEKAWKYYEYRFLKNKTMQAELPNLTQPLWDGTPIKDKTICVYTEQGLGDVINFARYLPTLNSMGAKVLLKMHKRFSPLKKLFEESDIKAEILDESIQGEEIKCDTHISILSIPHCLKTTIENIPLKDKYLKANQEKVRYYKEKYFNNDNFKLGIVWQCKNTESIDKYRSIEDLSSFYPFAKIPNVKVYSLQKGEGAEQLKNLPKGVKIVDLGSTFNDFSDTAAAIENLDLIISVDTSVPHLAGALGKPTWILLGYMHSWRWTSDLEISPWYNSVKLFRQIEQNTWKYPLEKALEELKLLVKEST